MPFTTGLYTHDLINQITLPNGTPYDVNDAVAVHYLGKTSSNVAGGTVSGTTITIGANNITPSVGDTVIYKPTNEDVSNIMYRCTAVNPATTEPKFAGSTVWECISPAAAEIPITAITVDGDATKVTVTNHVADITAINADLVAVVTEGEPGSEGYADRVAHNTLADGVRATTQTAGDNSTKLATTAYVDNAVEELPQAMIFRGSLGTGGTITDLPAAAKANAGDVYKVIVAGDYTIVPADPKADPPTPAETQHAEIGDLFICGQTGTGSGATYAWNLIPSGDVPAGTVTSVGVTAGLTTTIGDTTGTNPIIGAGTINLNLNSTSGITGDHVYAVGIGTAADSLEGKLVVATTKDTIMNTVTDATIANTVVTGVTATTAASSAPENAVTDVYTVANGVLTLNWLVATPATNAVFQVTPTPPTP